jgi:hypothetical protein
VKVDDGTGEVSLGRWLTSTVIAGISQEAKSRGMPGEKSEGFIVLVIARTT